MGMFRLWLSGLLLSGAAALTYCQSAQPVKVDFGARGPISGSTYRVGDTCYATLEQLNKWGWSWVPRGRETSISAEGRIFRVPTELIAGQQMVSLAEAARFLGAVVHWNSKKDTYVFKASVRSFDLTNEGFQVDSTIRVKPSFSLEASPWRLTVDIKGGVMDARLAESLPQGWTVSQADDDTVRLVISDPLLAGMNVPRSVESRSVRVKLPIKLMANVTLPEGQELTILEPVAQAGADAAPVQLGAPTIGRGDEGGMVVTVPTTRRLAGTPSVRYLSPSTIALSISGATFAQPGDQRLDGEEVKAVTASNNEPNASLTIALKSAGAFIVSTENKALVIRLFRPKKGKLAGKIIVVDPGHGGKDPGCDWDNELFEKDLTLKIGLATAKALKDAGASVIMTRDADTYPTLSERAALANNSDAAAFISIHINSNNVAETRSGGITFFHGQSPVGRMLAECIQTQIADFGAIPNMGAWSDTRIYRSGFEVLRESNMPAVLIELGFITHSHDRQAVQQQSYPAKVGAAIVQGLRSFFGDDTR